MEAFLRQSPDNRVIVQFNKDTSFIGQVWDIVLKIRVSMKDLQRVYGSRNTWRLSRLEKRMRILKTSLLVLENQLSKLQQEWLIKVQACDSKNSPPKSIMGSLKKSKLTTNLMLEKRIIPQDQLHRWKIKGLWKNTKGKEGNRPQHPGALCLGFERCLPSHG